MSIKNDKHRKFAEEYVQDLNGKRAHTYIWYDTWGSMSIAKTTMDYFLPKIETPKGSIVALDFEHGASANKQANTDTI